MFSDTVFSLHSDHSVEHTVHLNILVTFYIKS